jgi:hypothetical protein
LLPDSWLFLQAEPFGGAAVDEDLGQRSPDDLVAGRAMILTPVQDQAIAARMALIVGSITFDRLFGGVRFGEVDGDVLFAYAKDEESAAEIEDTFRPSDLDHRDGHPEKRDRHRHGLAQANGLVVMCNLYYADVGIISIP